MAFSEELQRLELERKADWLEDAALATQGKSKDILKRASQLRKING